MSLIRNHDGMKLINPRYIVSLSIQKEPSTLKWVVYANVVHHMSNVVLGVFDTALDAEKGLDLIAKAMLGIKE